MSAPTIDLQRELALDRVRDVFTIARRRGWELPAEYLAAVELRDAATAVATAPEPVGGPIPTAKDAAAWIKRLADERTRWRESRTVAAQLRNMAGAGHRRRWPWRRRRVYRRPMRRVRGHRRHVHPPGRHRTAHPVRVRSRAALEAHSELLRTVTALSLAARDRAVLALLSGEGADLGRAGAVWLIADPTTPTVDVDTVVAAVQATHTALPSTLQQWLDLAAVFTLDMSRVNTARRRFDTFNTAMQVRGQNESMGVARESWAQLRTRADTAAAEFAAQRLADQRRGQHPALSS